MKPGHALNLMAMCDVVDEKGVNLFLLMIYFFNLLVFMCTILQMTQHYMHRLYFVKYSSILVSSAEEHSIKLIFNLIQFNSIQNQNRFRYLLYILIY